MSEGIAAIAASMRADAEALQVIGQNIANADVTAYRRQIPLAATAFEQLLAPVTAQSADPALQPGAGATGAGKAALDWQAGTLKATGGALDVAIEGAGFFMLHSTGSQMLTRRGDFRISVDGLLSTAAGVPVLGVNGAIHVGTGLVQIDPYGVVRVNGEGVDRLAIARIADESQLQYIGDGNYVVAQSLAPDLQSAATVRSGFLESSNVSAVAEMVQMMETLRHFEASQRFVRGYDGMLEKAISELGKIE